MSANNFTKLHEEVAKLHEEFDPCSSWTFYVPSWLFVILLLLKTVS